MDGLECLALAYHWPPSVGMEFDLEDWREWVSRAERVLSRRTG